MAKIVINAPRHKKFGSVYKCEGEAMLENVDKEIENMCVKILCNAAEERKRNAPDFTIRSIDHFNGIGVQSGVRPTRFNQNYTYTN